MYIYLNLFFVKDLCFIIFGGINFCRPSTINGKCFVSRYASLPAVFGDEDLSTSNFRGFPVSPGISVKLNWPSRLLVCCTQGLAAHISPALSVLLA